jgi:hypothetical protein
MYDKTPFTFFPPLFYNCPRALFLAVDFEAHFISGVTNMVYIKLKSIKSLKNESALTKPKAPEKRISFKKGIVFTLWKPF